LIAAAEEIASSKEHTGRDKPTVVTCEVLGGVAGGFRGSLLVGLARVRVCSLPFKGEGWGGDGVHRCNSDLNPIPLLSSPLKGEERMINV